LRRLETWPEALVANLCRLRHRRCRAPRRPPSTELRLLTETRPKSPVREQRLPTNRPRPVPTWAMQSATPSLRVLSTKLRGENLRLLIFWVHLRKTRLEQHCNRAKRG